MAINKPQENSGSGYIKIFRSLMNKGWYKDSEYVLLWVHLLLKANHKEAEFLHGNKIIRLKAGQMVTGRDALSRETKINRNKVERILNLFENEHQIEQQKTNKNRIITIVSWDEYQQSEQQNKQQVSNKRATSEQQVSTNNNDNNDNNEKNIEYVLAQFEKFWDLYDNKTDRKKCLDKWMKLEQADIEKILSTVSDFKKYKPFEKYTHPNPLTYLNGQRWNDVIPKQLNGGKNKYTSAMAGTIYMTADEFEKLPNKSIFKLAQ